MRRFNAKKISEWPCCSWMHKFRKHRVSNDKRTGDDHFIWSISNTRKKVFCRIDYS